MTSTIAITSDDRSPLSVMDNDSLSVNLADKESLKQINQRISDGKYEVPTSSAMTFESINLEEVYLLAREFVKGELFSIYKYLFYQYC